jgi:hypothetical protein
MLGVKVCGWKDTLLRVLDLEGFGSFSREGQFESNPKPRSIVCGVESNSPEVCMRKSYARNFLRYTRVSDEKSESHLSFWPILNRCQRCSSRDSISPI